MAKTNQGGTVVTSREKALLGILVVLLAGAGAYLALNRPQAADFQVHTYSCSGKPTVGAFYPTSDSTVAPTKPAGSVSGTTINWTWSEPPIDELSGLGWHPGPKLFGVGVAHAGVGDNTTYCLADYQVDVGTAPAGSDINSQVATVGAETLASSSLAAGTYYGRVRGVWYESGSGVTWTTNWSANSDPVTIAGPTPTPTETTSSPASTTTTTSSPTIAASGSPTPTNSATTASPTASPTTTKTTTAATPGATTATSAPGTTDVAAVTDTGDSTPAPTDETPTPTPTTEPLAAEAGSRFGTSSLLWLSALLILLIALGIVWWFLARRRRFEEDEVRRNPNLWKRRFDS